MAQWFKVPTDKPADVSPSPGPVYSEGKADSYGGSLVTCRLWYLYATVCV